jgi:hypothetical protein
VGDDRLVGPKTVCLFDFEIADRNCGLLDGFWLTGSLAHAPKNLAVDNIQGADLIQRQFKDEKVAAEAVHHPRLAILRHLGANDQKAIQLLLRGAIEVSREILLEPSVRNMPSYPSKSGITEHGITSIC